MKDLKNKPSTVLEIQKYLRNLYGEANGRRDFEYLYAYLFRNASYLSRSIPRNNACVEKFIKTLSWLVALANKLEIDIQDAYLQKYPAVCPYCISKACLCAKTNKKPISYIKEWKIQEELRIKYNIAKAATTSPTMDSLVEMTNDLYPANIHIWKAAGRFAKEKRIKRKLKTSLQTALHGFYLLGGSTIWGKACTTAL